MDTRLPKLNGYEACRRIRDPGKDIVLIGFTGRGQKKTDKIQRRQI
jgi:CheY-like chemotaxis protein